MLSAAVGLVHGALGVEVARAILSPLFLAFERLTELALGLLGGGPRLVVGTHIVSIGAATPDVECGARRDILAVDRGDC